VASLKDEIAVNIKTYCHSDQDEEGYVLNDLHETLRDTISTYNDNVRGRCYICLEQLCDDLKAKFTERSDLARIDGCYHRFHLVCLYRDWFMKRHVEKDEHGGMITYKLEAKKRCPVCRKQVSSDDVEHV
jgi:hypothetical protein